MFYEFREADSDDGLYVRDTRELLTPDDGVPVAWTLVYGSAARLKVRRGRMLRLAKRLLLRLIGFPGRHLP